MSQTANQTDPRCCRREIEFWFVICFVAAVFLLRINTLPLHGEETRWSGVAVEMRETGDWLVPREQGELFVSRPPLQSWIIAFWQSLFDTRSPWLPRIPSVLAIVLTSALVYVYSRRFLQRVGAMAAALAYPTAGAVLVSGGDAETEPLFSLFLSSAFLLWHMGYHAGWGPIRTWCIAYSFAGLACLTKGGLQPPVYFVGGTSLFLLLQRDWRFLLSWGHLLGILVGLTLILLWAVPYRQQTTEQALMMIWLNDTATRFVDWKAGEVLLHLFLFPIEFFGCLLPWSLLGTALLSPTIRRQLKPRSALMYCLLIPLIAFPTCWFPPNGQTRYLYPIVPCLAVLIGLIVDAVTPQSPPALLRHWRRFLSVVLAVMLLTAVVVIFSAFLPANSRLGYLRFPLSEALLYVVALGILAALLHRCQCDVTDRQLRRAVVLIALTTAVFVQGMLMEIRERRANDVAAAVQAVQDQIDGAAIVSIGPVPHSFRYHFEYLIPLRIADKTTIQPGEYFCFLDHPGLRSLIPFDWELIAEVSQDRVRTEKPGVVVVVARRKS